MTQIFFNFPNIVLVMGDKKEPMKFSFLAKNTLKSVFSLFGKISDLRQVMFLFLMV